MASLTHLNALLSGIVNTGVTSDDQEVFDLLLTHRPNLLRILDVGPQSDGERRELQSGAWRVSVLVIPTYLNATTQAKLRWILDK